LLAHENQGGRQRSRSDNSDNQFVHGTLRGGERFVRYRSKNQATGGLFSRIHQTGEFVPLDGALADATLHQTR
jgi:hypothetical protein